MAKQRRTRQQKIIAQLRRQLMAQKPASAGKLIRQPIVDIPTPPTPTLAITPQNYSFVISDLRKTAIVTALILIGQILTFLFLIGRR